MQTPTEDPSLVQILDFIKNSNFKKLNSRSDFFRSTISSNSYYCTEKNVPILVNQSNIPDVVTESIKSSSFIEGNDSVSMGLLCPALNRAWIFANKTLFLWRYDDGGDVKSYTFDDDELILNIGIIPYSKKFSIDKDRNILLFLICVSKVVILNINEYKQQDRITQIEFTGSKVLQFLDQSDIITSCAAYDSHIFASTEEGHIYEIMPAGSFSDVRFDVKCHTKSIISRCIPKWLGFTKGSISKISFDCSKRNLWVLYSDSSIAAFDVSSIRKNDHYHLKIIKESIYSFANENSKVISLITSNVSANLYDCIAICSNGDRIFLKLANESRKVIIVHRRLFPARGLLECSNYSGLIPENVSVNDYTTHFAFNLSSSDINCSLQKGELFFIDQNLLYSYQTYSNAPFETIFKFNVEGFISAIATEDDSYFESSGIKLFSEYDSSRIVVLTSIGTWIFKKPSLLSFFNNLLDSLDERFLPVLSHDLVPKELAFSTLILAALKNIKIEGIIISILVQNVCSPSDEFSPVFIGSCELVAQMLEHFCDFRPCSPTLIGLHSLHSTSAYLCSLKLFINK